MTPAPNNPPPDPASSEVSLYGLPVRDPDGANSGRDPVEVAASEFVAELRRGHRPPISVYLRRYPQQAEQLREVLPLVAAMESWKLRQEFADARTSLPDTSTFDRLGNCRIVRELGRGGMGVVFEAVEEPSGRRVAVKLLPGRFPETSLWRQRFYGEAKTTARLQHHHIIPVYHFGEQDSWCYYVMHLVEGIRLDRIIRMLRQPPGVVTADQILRQFEAGEDAPIGGSQVDTSSPRALRRDSWPQVARIGMQVAAALRYAHAEGILHRDIKPANLLLDHHGSMWVADFGIALNRDPLLRGSADHLGGTLAYLAPEQLDGHVDVRSDLYSLGLTLYELATLQPAYFGIDQDSLLERVRTARPERPRAINRAIPPELESLILKAIDRDPAKRFQSADQLLGALEQFLKNKSTGAGAAQRTWLDPFSRLFPQK